MQEIFEKLVQEEDLSCQEIKGVFDQILQGEVSESQISALLLGLKMKGETGEEIAGVVQSLRSHANKLAHVPKGAMCNCGTGGDRSFSFNISTTCSFILAAGGISVAKAGNRSISSKSGSADVLESLGINIAADSKTLERALDEVGLAFIFAQSVHPAMRYIGPARQALGLPTIMNLVGPLANPVDLDSQLMGIYRADLQEVAAQAMKALGRKRAIIITGPDQLDEAALYGENTYTLLDEGKISQHRFSYRDLGMSEVPLAAIRGGQAQENAQILLSVLKNEASPYLETSVLNAGLGFYANGKVADLRAGVDLARNLLASGAALDKLKALQEVQV